MATSTYSKKKQQDPAISQLMPQNTDAEEAVLGAILVNPVCLTKVVEFITPDSFYKPAHRYVYEAMLQLFNSNERIDIVSVSDVLNLNQKLELVGGRAFINDLSFKTITTSNVEYYAKQIQEKAIKRSLINAGSEIVTSGYELTPVEESLEKAENSNEAVCVFDYIEEALFDGTHDKLHDDGLLKYHEAGKPKKLAVKWHIKKTEYVAYFWFEDERIREVFDKFYGAHPDTKTDFIIRIDTENKKYELALYRYGLKEPQIIPEDVYQLLVFKNKFEDYRSDNYDQERGAWIW